MLVDAHTAYTSQLAVYTNLYQYDHHMCMTLVTVYAAAACCCYRCCYCMLLLQTCASCCCWSNGCTEQPYAVVYHHSRCGSLPFTELIVISFMLHQCVHAIAIATHKLCFINLCVLLQSPHTSLLTCRQSHSTVSIVSSPVSSSTARIACTVIFCTVHKGFCFTLSSALLAASHCRVMS